MSWFAARVVLLTVGVLCLLCMLYFPEEGIKLNDNFTLTFASLDDFKDDDEGNIRFCAIELKVFV